MMSTQTRNLYEFGPYRLDGEALLLLRDGEPVPLMPKAVETLLVLVRNGGRVVSREELIGQVWPNTFVEENNLSVQVSALRKVLGTTPEGRPYIETLPRRGYRFTAGVSLAEENGHAVVVIERGVREQFVVVEEGNDAEVGLRTALDGETPERPPAIVVKRGLSFGRLGLTSFAVLLLTALGLFLYLRQPEGRNRPAPVRSIKSLAVLPLKTLGPEGQGDNYLGVGLADALITRLGGLGQINVRPTSAVLRFDTKHQDSLTAARALGVDAVLEGSYQLAGHRVRVTVQLVSAADGAQLWARSFDEKMGNIFALQDSISKEAARALVAALSEAEERLLMKRPTANVEAYQHYIKGRFYWNKRTSEGGAKALAHFEQAIALDPNYAQAYSGLADCYTLRLGLPPSEALARAKAAALRAVELDGSLAEARTSLAVVKDIFEFDPAGAEAEYRRALELDRNYALARGWYSMLLTHLGRFEEGAEQARLAKELDPTSPSLHIYAGWNYYHSRQYDRTIEEARKALELDPSINTSDILARAYAGKGMYETAITEALTAHAIPSNKMNAFGRLGYVYAAAGRTREARKILAEMREEASRSYVSPFAMAIIHAALGEKEEALRQLAEGIRVRDDQLYFMKVDPLLDGLRSEPEFVDLLRRAGLGP